MPLPFLVISPEVTHAIDEGLPVVALETAVVTHGLPAPHNLEAATGCEELVRAEGAVPATVAMLDGKLHVGLSPGEIERLAANRAGVKVSRRDIASAHVLGQSGGTTVAATLIAAEAAGIRVLSTGGIGGVHREPHDVSTDLPELARARVVVVCAGAKSILDLPATLEALETLGVPVLGYQSENFPGILFARLGLAREHARRQRGAGRRLCARSLAARAQRRYRAHGRVPRRCSADQRRSGTTHSRCAGRTLTRRASAAIR